MTANERHPKGLYVLFATEMWERFGFYTCAAIMTLYLQRGGFGWTKDQATTLWSNYLMFVYATPLIGGWLADRFLGYRRSVLLGGAVLHRRLRAARARVDRRPTTSRWRCCSSATASSSRTSRRWSGNLYPSGSPLKDSAYNIFYMGINIGALLAPVVAEVLLQTFAGTDDPRGGEGRRSP